MKIKISERNSKIGRISNISLPPGRSCVGGIKCLSDGCYAKNAMQRWPNVRDAWNHNLDMFYREPEQFFEQLENYLKKKMVPRFRFFVGGDFPNKKFYEMAEWMACNVPATKILAFTKRYDYNFSQKPDNFKIILSTWPGVELPKNKDLPWSWLREDPRRPESDYYVCPGNCDDCGHACWEVIEAGKDVMFHRH